MRVCSFVVGMGSFVLETGGFVRSFVLETGAFVLRSFVLGGVKEE